MDTKLLGRIPLDEATREGGDTGSPAALDPSTPVGAAFADIARAISGNDHPEGDGRHAKG
jgi:septum formation inhibitor-activating ATPase MinD